MSIKVMSALWDSGPQDKTALLVLLALADFCDDDGVCFPSIRRIAEKCRMTERGAQKVIRKMESDGWLTIKTGNGRHGTNVYKLHIKQKSIRAESEKIDRYQILRGANHRCLYCGYQGITHGQDEGVDLDLDHINPTSKGGADAPENIAVSCKPCNQEKKTKSIAQWVDHMNRNPERYSGEWRSDERCSGEQECKKPRTRVQETLNGGSPEPSVTIKEPSVSEILGGVASREVADDFIEHRRQMKKPLTVMAAKRMAKRLSESSDPDAVLSLSIENGWQGVFPDKVQKRPTPQGGAQPFFMQFLTREQRRAG